MHQDIRKDDLRGHHRKQQGSKLQKNNILLWEESQDILLEKSCPKKLFCDWIHSVHPSRYSKVSAAMAQEGPATAWAGHRLRCHPCDACFTDVQNARSVASTHISEGLESLGGCPLEGSVWNWEWGCKYNGDLRKLETGGLWNDWGNLQEASKGRSQRSHEDYNDCNAVAMKPSNLFAVLILPQFSDKELQDLMFALLGFSVLFWSHSFLCYFSLLEWECLAYATVCQQCFPLTFIGTHS